jgi:hypothetical protein
LAIHPSMEYGDMRAIHFLQVAYAKTNTVP